MSTDPRECAAAAGKTPEAITTQKFAVLGAGSAGMGVVCMLAKGMVKHVLTPLTCLMHARYVHRANEYVLPSSHAFARLLSTILP